MSLSYRMRLLLPSNIWQSEEVVRGWANEVYILEKKLEIATGLLDTTMERCYEEEVKETLGPLDVRP